MLRRFGLGCMGAFGVLAACQGLARAADSSGPAAETPLGDLPLKHDVDPGWSGIGLLQLLILAVFLLFWLGWLWRRQGRGGLRSWPWKGGDPQGLRVVQSAVLTPRASVHVVRWDGREWLVGCTESGLTELGRRPQSEAAAGPGSPS